MIDTAQLRRIISQIQPVTAADYEMKLARAIYTAGMEDMRDRAVLACESQDDSLAVRRCVTAIRDIREVE